MSAPGSPVCAPDWLALREPADAIARSAELAGILRERLDGSPLVIRDLGCGSGSMGRWLAPRLPGPQTWILHDRDPELLALAAHGLPRAALDGAPVTARSAPGDLADLRASDLAGTTLVTASALLDLLTVDEVDALAAACVAARCPALLTLSVTGRAQLSPAKPLDAEFAAAFDAHQRRVDGRDSLAPGGGDSLAPGGGDSLAPGGGDSLAPGGGDSLAPGRGRRLLGPDAAAVAVASFDRRGATVLTRPSPWLLGPAEAELAEEWLRGWIAAACVQRPALQAQAGPYLRRRLDACAAGALRVAVGHLDVLALPDGPQGGGR